MMTQIIKALPQFLETLGLDEEPMGIFYTDEEPAEGFSPKPNELPTRAKEMKNEINWQEVFSQFSCVMGHIWRARKKKAVAYFSAEQFGCPGGAFWLGFNKPQAETIINYVSTGIPNWTDPPAFRTGPRASCIVIRRTRSDEFSNMSTPDGHPTSFVLLNPSANFQMLKCRN
jgi:uncharacterized protein (DUF169 family)